MPSVQRGGKLPVGYESLGKGKRKIGGFEKKHGIPPEAVRKSKKPKPARSDMYLGIKPSAPRCPTCASQVEFINLYYKNHPKEKNAGAQGGVINSKMFCPKCGGIPRRKAVRSDSVMTDKVRTKLYHPHVKIKGEIFTQTLSFLTKSMADLYAKKRKKEGYLTKVKKEGKGKNKTLYTVYIKKEG